MTSARLATIEPTTIGVRAPRWWIQRATASVATALSPRPTVIATDSADSGTSRPRLTKGKSGGIA